MGEGNVTRDFAKADKSFAVGTRHEGFTVTSVEPLAEIDGVAYVMTHDATKARVMWLSCADTNKSFSIAFKTPPADSTGVFHILEHSVLCGSDRFPVKEPFVNLLKTSMQTFLNALTFSDKTMYPVASTNGQDLMNLMDIYLDAVLHPSIYLDNRRFEQEGWHYEIGEDGDLRYNGVVFNEMKGAMSDPDDVLLEHVDAALFPDSPYGFNSGGDPRVIPTLTYESYLDTHARHYQLSNSYTVLYGDIDSEQVLSLLDRRFLDAADRGAGEPNALPVQPEVAAGLSRVTMETAPENACVGLAYVFGTSHDRDRVLAMSVLLDALAGSNEAPLKRAVLDAGLGDDLSAVLIDGIAQPFVLFELKGARPGVAQDFRDLVERTCSELVASGIGQDNLRSSLAQAEFDLREGDWGYPDGVALSIQAMSGWLYDDEEATSFLRYEDAIARMRDGMATGLFEDLLASLMGSAHTALVDLVPGERSGESDEARELAAAKAAMSEDDLAAIGREVEALRAAQEAPDAPDDLAKLPQLGIADIGDGETEPAMEQVEAPLPCYTHAIPTRRIDYVSAFFDLSCVAFAELPYVAILCDLLGKLDTKRHTALELDSIVEERLGSLSFYPFVAGDDHDPLVAHPYLVVSASSLSENAESLATLPAEIWSSTLFEDKERMRNILQQRRISYEQSFVGSGHACALSRVSSYYSALAVVSEQLSGVDGYLFLKRLLDGFDHRWQGMGECLRNLCARIFVTSGATVSFTGPDEDLRRYWDAGGTLSLDEPAGADGGLLVVPAPKVRREAFVIPADVSFSATGTNGLPLGFVASGQWDVAARALSFDYLWNEVRVKGGAYGCGFSCTPGGLLRCYSYRDPAIDPTIERFGRAGSWLSSWRPGESEFEGYVVSTVAGHDAPKKPRVMAARQDSRRLSGRPDDWDATIRAQELSSTPGAIRGLAPILEAAGPESSMVVFGGRDIIAASRQDLEVIELMGGGGD